MMPLPATQCEYIARTAVRRSRATPPRRGFLARTVEAVHVASGRYRLPGRPQNHQTSLSPPGYGGVPGRRGQGSCRRADCPCRPMKGRRPRVRITPLCCVKPHPRGPAPCGRSSSRECASPGLPGQSISLVLLGLDQGRILIIDVPRGQDRGPAARRPVRCSRLIASYADEPRARGRSFRHVTCTTDSSHRPDSPGGEDARSEQGRARLRCEGAGSCSRLARIEARRSKSFRAGVACIPHAAWVARRRPEQLNPLLRAAGMLGWRLR